MIFFTRLIAFGILALSLGCSSTGQEQDNASGGNEAVSPPADIEASVLIVTANEKYESLMVQTTDSGMERTILRDTVDLRSRNGILCQNEPRNPDVHYGFQTKADLSQYFIAMYKGNLMKEELDWCRLYAYDPTDKVWTQLISFGEIHSPIWKYVEEQNAVFYIDRSSDLLLAYSLEDGITDTLGEVQVDVRQHAFRSGQGNIQMTYANEGQIHQLEYDTTSGQLNKSLKAPIDQFSSIHEKYLLQVYYTDPGEQGFRLYEEKDLIADQVFKVGNVNSFWNDQNQFYLQGENHIFLMNTELDTLNTIQLNSPFIYNVLDQHILAHERSQENKAGTQTYLLSKDLSGKQSTDLLEDAAWTVLVKNL